MAGWFHRLWLIVCLVAGLGMTSSAAGQTPTFVDSIDVTLVTVDVVVTDRKGRPVSGLEKDDFLLRVDGMPVEATSFLETSLRGPGASGSPQLRSPGEATTDPPAATLPTTTIALHIDESNLRPEDRFRLLKALEAAVEPWRACNARFLLSVFRDRQAVVVPPTTDIDAVLAGAAGLGKPSGRTALETRWRRRLIREIMNAHDFCQQAPMCRPCYDDLPEMLSIARRGADQTSARTAMALAGLADLVVTLSGIPGRKAVVYVSSGLSRRPAISLFDYIPGSLCPETTAQREAYAGMVQHDDTSAFNRLSAHANANGVTLYTLDAAGLRAGMASGIDFLSRKYAPQPENDNLHSMNVQSGLFLLADETGGKALLNSNDLAELMADVGDHLAVSYSLGFLPEDPQPGRVRLVEVKLRPGLPQRHRLEYRRSYRDKTLDERLAERLVSVVSLGGTANPLGAAVRLLPTTPVAGDVHELVVEVAVPREAIVELQGPDGRQGAVRLWMLAVESEQGHRTLVRQQVFPLGAEADGSPEVFRVQVGMNLPVGNYKLAVGVRDETAGTTSLLREEVQVPAGDSPERAVSEG